MIKSSIVIEGKYSLVDVLKVLFDINNWKLWNTGVSEVKVIKKYSKNLVHYEYVFKSVSGIHYRFNEKKIAFKEGNMIYIYSSEVMNKKEQLLQGEEKGNLIIEVTKIYVNEGDILIDSIRQSNVDKLDEEEYRDMYIKFKQDLLKRLDNINMC